MRAGSNQRQDKSIALNLVDEEPILLDVAFSERLPIPGQRVIFVSGIQLCLVGQTFDNSVKQIHVKMAFHGHLVVFFELRSPNNFKAAHFLSSLKASSTSNPLTLGSLDNLSASSKASVVSRFGSSILTSNGNPPTVNDLRKKTFMAVVRLIPSSPYTASDFFFKSLSNLTLKFVVAIISPSLFI